MKKIPTWAVFGVLAAVIYLLWKSGGVDALRRDAYNAGRRISQNTDGAIPAPPRSWLPQVTPDPRFGVSLPDDWLKLDIPDLPVLYAGGVPGFYSGAGATQATAQDSGGFGFGVGLN